MCGLSPVAFSHKLVKPGVPWGLFPGRYLSPFTKKQLTQEQTRHKDEILATVFHYEVARVR